MESFKGAPIMKAPKSRALAANLRIRGPDQVQGFGSTTRRSLRDLGFRVLSLVFRV